MSNPAIDRRLGEIDRAIAHQIRRRARRRIGGRHHPAVDLTDLGRLRRFGPELLIGEEYPTILVFLPRNRTLASQSSS